MIGMWGVGVGGCVVVVEVVCVYVGCVWRVW